MKIRHAGVREERIELQMTPMIDIVFQLLIFFIMTFKIVALEGDFNITMPLADKSKASSVDPSMLAMRLRMTANQDGTLAGMKLNDLTFSGADPFEQLHNHIIGVIGLEAEHGADSLQESAEVELDCDYGLHYEYVIAAITAISGHKLSDRQTIKLVEKIKFAPPATPPEGRKK